MGREMSIDSIDFGGSKAQKYIIYILFQNHFKKNRFDMLVAHVPKKEMENIIADANVFLQSVDNKSIDFTNEEIRENFINKFKYYSDKTYTLDEVLEDFRTAVKSLTDIYWQIILYEPKIRNFIIDYN
jgi:hypothetical protein